MHLFRSRIFLALLSPLMAFAIVVGGGLIPTLHDALHHPAERVQGMDAHCKHEDHRTAFEIHHSTPDSAQCLFHQRQTTSVPPSTDDVASLEGPAPALTHDTGRLPETGRSTGPWTRGPPLSEL